MNQQPILFLDAAVRDLLWQHLIRGDDSEEEAAFMYVRPKDQPDYFECIEWTPIQPNGFISRSAYYFELTDSVRAAAIKRAHDLNASLVEFHSHVGPWPARFSPTDLSGFQECVPHMLWRLKARPYFAIVVSRSGFDGLSWTNGQKSPDRLVGISTGGILSHSTGLTPLKEHNNEE